MKKVALNSNLSVQKNRRILQLALFLVFLFILVSLFFVSANVNDGWDWNQPGRRTLNYSFTADVPAEWRNWTREAAGIVNGAGTGWVLQEGSLSGDHIKISFNSSIHPTTLGETDWGDRFGRNDSRLTYRNITIYNETYGRINNSYDPVKVMLHELLHTLRLRHHNASQAGIMNATIRSGDHNTTLSSEDLAQMKSSHNSTVNVPRVNVTSAGTNASIRSVAAGNITINLTIPSNPRNGSASFHQWFHELWDSILPFRNYINPERDVFLYLNDKKHYLAYALEIETTVPIEIIPLSLVSSEPIPLTFDMAPVPGQKQGTIKRNALDEFQLKAFMYDPLFDVFFEVQMNFNPFENRIDIPYLENIQPKRPNLIVFAAPILEYDRCIDYDFGLNYQVKGKTSFNNVFYEDYCSGDRVVVEHYCYYSHYQNQMKMKTQNFLCPKLGAEHKCIDGKCSLPSPPPTPEPFGV